MEFKRLVFNIFNYQYYFFINLTTLQCNDQCYSRGNCHCIVITQQSAASIKFISKGRKQIYYNMIFHKTRI